MRPNVPDVFASGSATIAPVSDQTAVDPAMAELDLAEIRLFEIEDGS